MTLNIETSEAIKALSGCVKCYDAVKGCKTRSNNGPQKRSHNVIVAD